MSIRVVKGTKKYFYCYNCRNIEFKVKELNNNSQYIYKSFFECQVCGTINSIPNEYIRDIETNEYKIIKKGV